MTSIELMVEEHKYILRMLDIFRKASYKILQGDEINYEHFNQMIDFIRIYADGHHHGKEEKFLFKEIVDNLGSLGNKLITHGMLVEHDYARLYISELEQALNRVKKGDDESKLDIISNAISYTQLLKRHIYKEDNVVYTFAKKQLSVDIIEKVNAQSKDFEDEASDKGIQNKYIKILENLEKLYI